MSGGHCYTQKNAATTQDWSTTPEAQARFGLIAHSAPESSSLQTKVTRLPKPKPSDYTWMSRSPMVQQAKARLAQAKCSECGKKKVQRQESGAVQESPPVGQIAAAGFQGSAQKLPHLTQVEQSFGRSMGHVQAYVGGAAAKACDALGAEAYASGNKVAFKEAPGKALVGHEAAHVVQQESGKVQLSGKMGRPGDKYEQNADAVGEKVEQGQDASGLLSTYKKSGVQLKQNTSEDSEESSEDGLKTRNHGRRGEGVHEDDLEHSCPTTKPQCGRDCDCMRDAVNRLQHCVTDARLASALANIAHFMSKAGGNAVPVPDRDFIRTHPVVIEAIPEIIKVAGRVLASQGIIAAARNQLEIGQGETQVELPPPGDTPGYYVAVESNRKNSADYFYAYGNSALWGQFTRRTNSALTVRREKERTVKATGSMLVSWNDEYNWHHAVGVRIAGMEISDRYLLYLQNECDMARSYKFEQFSWLVPVQLIFNGRGNRYRDGHIV